MGETKLSISVLKREDNIGYGSQDLPSKRDAELRAVLERELIADPSPRVTPDMFPVLRVFAERATSLAVREANPSLLRLGLQALALADLRSRESLTILPLFIDAAERVGMDPRVLFGTVGNGFGGQIQKVLGDFLGRDSGDRSLTAMGYEISGDGATFRYRRTW